jgi:inner membrane transporter RhtA
MTTSREEPAGLGGPPGEGNRSIRGRHRALRVRRYVPGPLLVIQSILFLQCGAALAKQVFPKVGPEGLLAIRLMSGAIVLLLVNRSKIGLSRRDLLTAVALGTALLGMNWTFYGAIERLPLGVVVAVQFLGPIGVGVAAARRVTDVIGLLLAGAGVFILHGIHGDSGMGMALAFASAGFLGVYIKLADAVGHCTTNSAGIALAVAWAALIIAPFGFAKAGPHLAGLDVLVIGFTVGILTSVISPVLDIAALRRIRISTFSVLLSTEPVLAAITGYVLLDEHLDAIQWGAVTLVALACAATTFERRKVGRVDLPGCIRHTRSIPLERVRVWAHTRCGVVGHHRHHERSGRCAVEGTVPER